MVWPWRPGCVVDRAEFRIRARSLDAQLLRLACEYEDLLTDLRENVSSGNPHLDPANKLDERLDRICLELFSTASVFARVDTGRRASEDAPARWWHADIAERTYMDLRRWLDRCLREHLLNLELRELPSAIRDSTGERVLSASSDRRTVARVVTPKEQAWLLCHWPAQLREPDPQHVPARGKLA